MTWFDWFLVAWWSLSSFVVIATVGKPRTPIEPLTAAFMVTINAAFVIVLLLTRGVL